MKIKKIPAVLAACIVMTAMTGNMYAGAENISSDDFSFHIDDCYGFRWPDDDGSFSQLLGDIRSEKSTFVIKPKYEDRTVKIIRSLSSASTEYLVLPDGCVMTEHNAFGDMTALKGISIPESITSIEDLNKAVTVVGDPGSYAEFFAKRNGNPFVLSGDTNNDGKVGATDIVSEMLYLTGEEAFESEISELAADVSHDGVINIIDLICLKRNALGGTKNNFKAEDIMAVPVYKSSRTAVSADALDPYIDFTASFADNVLLDTEDKKDGCNRVYSPLSIFMAASVLTDCCDSKSFDELAAFLSVSDKTELQEINKNIFDSLYFNDFEKYCMLTNSIWLSRKYEFKREKLETLAEKYYTSSFTRDFRSQTDCDEIAEWIYQNTSGKFRPLIMADEDRETLLKIINTVTFKEKWSSSFDNSDTGTFKSADGDVECTFMYEEDRGATVVEDDDFMTYTKYFEDGFAMNFVLPAEEKSVDDLVSDSELMKKILKRTDAETANVSASIPKFKSESKFDLIKPFKASGVNAVFESADISSLIDFDENDLPGAYVDKIIHEAVIDVNEKGCEAAAYTMIDMVPNCPVDDAPFISFRADRPFFYFITNESGVPVFMGIVNDPAQK